MLKVLLSCLLLLVETFHRVSVIAQDVNPLPLQKEFPEKCYDLLGCFGTAPPFYDPPQRPLALLPFDLEHIDTKFHLYTPWNPLIPFTLNFTGESLFNSSFDPRLETKVIIHGFHTFLSDNDLFHTMKNAILQSGHYNVILVDWTDSNRPPYQQSVSNLRVVAAQLAYLLNVLRCTKGLRMNSVHLIGHSMGAHLAGLTGKRARGLGRITGLDPAGPYFHKADPLIRLDADDAMFVDIIHTNAGSNYPEGLGIPEAIGHFDFYPNGGNQQPGCSDALPEGPPQIDDFDPLRNGCSHYRAVALFLASIADPSCRFWSTPCSSFEDYIEGRCNDRFRSRKFSAKSLASSSKVLMGFHTMKPRFVTRGQKYFLTTEAYPPYCVATTVTDDALRRSAGFH